MLYSQSVENFKEQCEFISTDCGKLLRFMLK